MIRATQAFSGPPGAGKRRGITVGPIAYTEDFPRHVRGVTCAWRFLCPMGNVGGGKVGADRAVCLGTSGPVSFRHAEVPRFSDAVDHDRRADRTESPQAPRYGRAATGPASPCSVRDLTCAARWQELTVCGRRDATQSHRLEDEAPGSTPRVRRDAPPPTRHLTVPRDA